MESRIIRRNLQPSKKIFLKLMKFNHFQLAYEVRSKIYSSLISFDANLNLRLQSSEIQRALVELFRQSPEEIAYVTRNVSRYDLNNDGIITYEEFSNFCLEQHFGELALQRLHKKGMYKNGKKKIMVMEEFIQTLNYYLSFLQIHPEQQTLRHLFYDIDRQSMGSITYSQYFQFLREYFGTNSKSANEISIFNFQSSKNLNTTFTTPSTKKSILDQTASTLLSTTFAPTIKTFSTHKIYKRFADLVYLQLKVVAVNYDTQKLLAISKSSGNNMLQNYFKFQFSTSNKIQQTLMRKNLASAVCYEEFISTIVETYFCSILPPSIKYPLNQDDFVQLMLKKVNFLSVKPSSLLLRDIFSLGSKKDELCLKQMTEMMEDVFGEYEWKRKTGELRMK